MNYFDKLINIFKPKNIEFYKDEIDKLYYTDDKKIGKVLSSLIKNKNINFSLKFEIISERYLTSYLMMSDLKSFVEELINNTNISEHKKNMYLPRLFELEHYHLHHLLKNKVFNDYEFQDTVNQFLSLPKDKKEKYADYITNVIVDNKETFKFNVDPSDPRKDSNTAVNFIDLIIDNKINIGDSIYEIFHNMITKNRLNMDFKNTLYFIKRFAHNGLGFLSKEDQYLLYLNAYENSDFTNSKEKQELENTMVNLFHWTPEQFSQIRYHMDNNDTINKEYYSDISNFKERINNNLFFHFIESLNNKMTDEEFTFITILNDSQLSLDKFKEFYKNISLDIFKKYPLTNNINISFVDIIKQCPEQENLNIKISHIENELISKEFEKISAKQKFRL